MKRQIAYCRCTPFRVRLSYNSTRLLSLCMHCYTLNEVFHMAAIRASKKSALGASKFAALRAMHFPILGMSKEIRRKKNTDCLFLFRYLNFLIQTRNSLKTNISPEKNGWVRLISILCSNSPESQGTFIFIPRL